MLRLRRTSWPRELSEAVAIASRHSPGGKEDILAAVQLLDGSWVAGGRAALYLPTETDGTVRRVGWEKIERAGWDSEESVLRVYETTAFGTPLRSTELKVEDPGRFGQLLRERIDASVLIQRHVVLSGKKGVRVVGRRNPSEPDAQVHWNFVLDKGLEPSQPGVVDGAEAALAAVRDEFGI
ncbi:hypothetical protein [Kribbella sp. CA-293567]|uniref:hypothetical protein n=1 Tax=Kribbella sp. CA-293567 TaxID=3002436 RepID=UPI0022DD8698|nr:hypothetical protein [Kribbella sp. CA-293567]WBQ03045.1 hypothetical protein OX958_24050 [Kribbella sp. CA-293567]